MLAPTSAARHYRRLQRLKVVTLSGIRRAWRRMEPNGSWERQYEQQVGPQILALALASQVAAARESDAYVAEVLNELAFGPETRPGVVNPTSLAGYAGDGRPVESLLSSSVGRARSLTQQMSVENALADAQTFLETVTQTLIEDAMRAAEDIAMAPREWVDGWVRMINPPCCSRCAILSGKFFLWNEGFQRHPRCDCYHVPAPADGPALANVISVNSPERYFESLTDAEQDRIFTKAGAEAIRDGADMGRVVNARRGMARAQVGGRAVLTTTTGTNDARPRKGQRRRIRLMPETLMELADGDRAEFVRLLRANGFITT